jgi:hypothetical protein
MVRTCLLRVRWARLSEKQVTAPATADQANVSALAQQAVQKGAPGQSEPEVGVEAPAKPTEVVGRGDEEPERDKGQEPGRGKNGPGDPERGRAGQGQDGQRPEHAVRNTRLQRAVQQLVEGMGADPHS